MDRDMSLEAQGQRIRKVYQEEIDKKNNRKTKMLMEIPKEPDMKIVFKKPTVKKTKRDKICIIPPKNQKNIEKIKKTVEFVEENFIGPLLGDRMPLFLDTIENVRNGKEKEKAYKALHIFSKKIKIDFSDIYNIKFCDFHETVDLKMRQLFAKINKLYQEEEKVPAVPVVPVVPSCLSQEFVVDSDSDYSDIEQPYAEDRANDQEDLFGEED